MAGEEQLPQPVDAQRDGEQGEGVEDEYSKPLIGDWPVTKLIHYVDRTMPDYDPNMVKGKEVAWNSI